MERAAGSGDYAFIAEYYDHVVPYRDREDVAFFVELAKESSGPVLEIGSGTGRILIPTAREGIEIVGIDNSEAMHAICREKLSIAATLAKTFIL